MKKFSKNVKLNTVLNGIYEELERVGISEIKRYYNEFKNEPDFNIAQYGNMLIYYDEIREFYKKAGYKSIEKMSDSKVWEIYKKQVGYVARKILLENHI